MTLKTNALWNVCSNLTNILILFIITPIIQKDLGEVHYGVYVILGTIGGALSILNLGLGDATLRYVAFYHSIGNKKAVNSTFNATLWLYTILGGLVTFLFLLFPNILIKFFKIQDIVHIEELIRLTMLMFFTTFISGCFFAIPQALQRYDIYSFIQLSQNILRFFLNLGAILLGFGIRGLIITNFFLSLILIIVLYAVAKRLIPYLSLFKLPRQKDYREIFGYGIYSFLSQLIGTIWQYCDPILLTRLIGPYSVGYFSIPMQLIGKVNSVPSAAFSVLFPRFASEQDIQQTKKLYIKSTQISLYTSILLFVPMAVVFSDFLALWISEDFMQKGGMIATILAFSYIVRGSFLPYEPLLKGIGKPQYVMIITGASSLIILIFDLFMIPRYGINGVGIAYIVSSFVGIATVILIWKKLIKGSYRQLMLKLGVPFIISIISFISLYYLNSYYSSMFTLNYISFIIETILSLLINGLILSLVVKCTDRQLYHELLRNIVDIYLKLCKSRNK